MADPDFWNDNDKAQKIIGEMNAIKSVVTDIETMQAEYEDLEVTRTTKA
jgi:peptide chain release factor 2